MLCELSVKNLALIDSLNIDFGEGANVMTGETGAGKSILVGALGLLTGRRGTADLVRAGAEEAEVSALFQLDDPGNLGPVLEELGLPPAEELVLRRVVGSSGRSRAYINGRSVPQVQLAALGEELISISGQHDQQSLLKPASQLHYLDRFGGRRDLLEEMRLKWQALVRARDNLAALEGRLKQAEEKRDLYEFQLAEINRVAPRPGEDDELLAEKNRARDGERLLENLTEAAEVLGGEPGNVVEKLGRVRRLLEKAAEYDDRFGDGFGAVENSYHQLADLAADLEKANRELDVDPGRLEWVDERLNTLAKLKRKYGLPLNDLVARGRELGRVLDELDGAGLELAELRREKERASAAALAAADRLHLARREAGEKLAAKLAASLRPLGFPKLELEVRVEGPPAEGGTLEKEKRLGPGGFDRVEILISPNPGEGLKPLAKIASGGELSRVMLALKTVADRPGDQLLVFDEIDAGLGGATAEAVAVKMAELARHQQVVVITHLPRMAALAGRHFVVAKAETAGEARTVTTITKLADRERTGELARMLGGASPGPEAVALAERLLAAGGAS